MQGPVGARLLLCDRARSASDLAGADGFVPLDNARARDTTVAQVRASRSEALRGLRVERVAVDATTVEVTVSARVRLPFVNAITGHPDGVPITATAAARSPLTP